MPSNTLKFCEGVSQEDQEQVRAMFATMERAKAERMVRKKRVIDVMEMDYHEQYLRSARWRRIKQRILERDKHVCQCCGGYGKVVHHRSYSREVLEGNDDSMLATVCDGCHNLIHFTDDDVMRTDAETDAEFLKGQRQTDIPPIDLDLRRKFAPPPNWQRLTAVQRKLWNEERHRQRHAKWLKLHPNEPVRKAGGFFSPEYLGPWLEKPKAGDGNGP